MNIPIWYILNPCVPVIEVFIVFNYWQKYAAQPTVYYTVDAG